MAQKTTHSPRIFSKSKKNAAHIGTAHLIYMEYQTRIGIKKEVLRLGFPRLGSERERIFSAKPQRGVREVGC